jgi:hypothetical protein
MKVVWGLLTAAVLALVGAAQLACEERKGAPANSEGRKAPATQDSEVPWGPELVLRSPEALRLESGKGWDEKARTTCRVQLREVDRPTAILTVKMLGSLTPGLSFSGGHLSSKPGGNLSKMAALIQSTPNPAYRMHLKLRGMFGAGTSVDVLASGEEYIMPSARETPALLADDPQPWFWRGAELVLQGNLQLFGAKVDSDKDYPLALKVTKDALVRICGSAKVNDLTFGVGETPALWLSRADSKDALVRQGAAAALGYLAKGNREAVNTLAKLLKDGDWEVRRNAAEALGRLRDPAATSPLQQAAKDSNEWVAEVITWALNQIQDGKEPGK